MQRRAAHHLDVEVALAECARGGLAHRGERLGQEVVERFDALLAVRPDRVEPGAELGRQRAQLLVGASLHLGLERGDLRDDRLEHFELAALAGVEDLVEEAHTGNESTFRRASL